MTSRDRFQALNAKNRRNIAVLGRSDRLYSASAPLSIYIYIFLYITSIERTLRSLRSIPNPSEIIGLFGLGFGFGIPKQHDRSIGLSAWIAWRYSARDAKAKNTSPYMRLHCALPASGLHRVRNSTLVASSAPPPHRHHHRIATASSTTPTAPPPQPRHRHHQRPVAASSKKKSTSHVVFLCRRGGDGAFFDYLT